MVTSITDSHSSNILAGLAPQQATPSESADSFTAQLTSALQRQQLLSAHGVNLALDGQAPQSQDSGVRQLLATNSASGHNTTPDASTTPPASTDGSTATFLGFVSVPAIASTSTTTGTTGGTPGSTSEDTSATGTTAATPAPMTEVDAYWAAQPPEVQQLRNITDFATRSAAAEQLADQGFTIDKAIMVWGWDPLKTMLTRQMYGYTWAPNMNQGNVSTPGLTLPGQTAYDPNNAPPGSIAVTTSFAKGTIISDPWSASQLQANS